MTHHQGMPKRTQRQDGRQQRANFPSRSAQLFATVDNSCDLVPHFHHGESTNNKPNAIKINKRNKSEIVCGFVFLIVMAGLQTGAPQLVAKRLCDPACLGVSHFPALCQIFLEWINGIKSWHTSPHFFLIMWFSPFRSLSRKGSHSHRAND